MSNQVSPFHWSRVSSHISKHADSLRGLYQRARSGGNLSVDSLSEEPVVAHSHYHLPSEGVAVPHSHIDNKEGWELLNQVHCSVSHHGSPELQSEFEKIGKKLNYYPQKPWASPREDQELNYRSIDLAVRIVDAVIRANGEAAMADALIENFEFAKTGHKEQLSYVLDLVEHAHLHLLRLGHGNMKYPDHITAEQYQKELNLLYMFSESNMETQNGGHRHSRLGERYHEAGHIHNPLAAGSAPME